MKYIISILFLFGFVAANAQATYPMRRTNGNAIVTDVALTATEYFRLPTFNAAVPNLGSYADSTGRVLFNRFDSNILVRNNGSYLFFQPSTKTVNLIGSQTITGGKIFSAATQFSSTTLFQGIATFNSSISAGGQINPAVDIQWANNTGFGLRGSDGVRYLSYTTAGGVIVGTTATPIDLKSLTTAGVVLNSSTGRISSIARLTSANIDTGRAADKLVNGGSLNKVKDSITAAIATSVTTKKVIGGSSAPSVTLGANITGSVSVVGTDLAGTVTVTVTGASGLATLNELFTLTYNSAYSSTPHVVWSPSSPNAAALLQAAGGLYLKNSGTSSFQIATVNSYSTPASATYSFTYHVIQ